jgi:hypothetical protein
MFRHALGVMYADGQLDPAERVFVERLASTLHVRKGDEAKIRHAFSEVHGEPNLRRVLELIGGSKKDRVPAPDSEEYARIDAERAKIQKVERERKQGIQEVLRALDESGPAWAESVADQLGGAVVWPLLQAFDDYGNLDEDCSIADLVNALLPEALLGAVNDQLPEVKRALAAYAADLERGFAFSTALSSRFDATWDRVVNDDSGWESALYEIDAAGDDIIEAEPSGVGQAVTGGVLGFAGAALLGPVGWIGAAAATYMDGEVKSKNFSRAAKRWDSAVGRFADSTDRWRGRATGHIQEFLLAVVDEVRQFVAQAGSPEEASVPVQQMYVDLQG